MMRFIVFAAALAAVYYFTRQWWPVGALAAAYILYSVIAGALGSARAKRSTNALLNRKLSEEEKAHLDAQAEHQKAMYAHKAQFDPELRKKL
jgi:hypothetical protein